MSVLLLLLADGIFAITKWKRTTHCMEGDRLQQEAVPRLSATPDWARLNYDLPQAAACALERIWPMYRPSSATAMGGRCCLAEGAPMVRQGAKATRAR